LTFESSSRIDATKRRWKFVPCTWASRRKGPVSERRCSLWQVGDWRCPLPRRLSALLVLWSHRYGPTSLLLGRPTDGCWTIKLAHLI